MGLQCGIVGLPNVGKSTLFNAITRAGAQSANFPFCTIEPNFGRVPVPDSRLDEINAFIKAQSVIPTFIDLVDIAGLVKGASRGEGLGNQFLGHIRQVDAIIHLVRCFEDENVIHVDGEPNPVRDVETINSELIFSDIDTVTKSVDKVSRLVKNGDRKIITAFECGTRLKAHFENLLPARTFVANDEEEIAYLKSLNLITIKPIIYVANVSEDDLSTEGKNSSYVKILKEIATQENTSVVLISARIEEELAELDDKEAKEYLASLNVSDSGLSRLISACYQLLGLMTYFTAGVKEVRAWTIKKGFRAPEAAGVIHTDFEKGFICAEVYSYHDLVRLGSEAKVRENGLVRKEGKEYVCHDGDIIHFLFNV